MIIINLLSIIVHAFVAYASVISVFDKEQHDLPAQQSTGILKDPFPMRELEKGLTTIDFGKLMVSLKNGSQDTVHSYDFKGPIEKSTDHYVFTLTQDNDGLTVDILDDLPMFLTCKPGKRTKQVILYWEIIENGLVYPRIASKIEKWDDPKYYCQEECFVDNEIFFCKASKGWSNAFPASRLKTSVQRST